ncbi:hypothetical protein HDV05_006792 [Chytridiales sp. JEL 0842]|nr:hypothetical protein HDV05_006792 [Chytridiales sp. JEL 0842]
MSFFLAKSGSTSRRLSGDVPSTTSTTSPSDYSSTNMSTQGDQMPGLMPQKRRAHWNPFGDSNDILPSPSAASDMSVSPSTTMSSVSGSPPLGTTAASGSRPRNPRELHRPLFQQLPRPINRQQTKQAMKQTAKDLSATITVLASISLLTKDELKAIDNNTDDPWDGTSPASATSEQTLRAKKRESSTFKRRRSVLGKNESGRSADQKELRDLRASYALNFARLREEVDLLMHRSVRLQMLGVDPDIDFAKCLRSKLRILGENLPWRELSVAVVGPKEAGKSTLLSKLMGRSNLLGNGETLHHYALVHNKAAPEYSPSLAKPSRNSPEVAHSMVIVSHNLDRFEKIAFLDTAGVSPTTKSPESSVDVISFSGLNLSDPSIVSVSIADAGKSAPVQQDVDGSTTQTTLQSSLADILKSEAVDVVLLVLRPDDIKNLATNASSESAPLSDLTNTIMDNSTLPMLVVHKVDNVWDRIHAFARNDDDFKAEYEQWKQSVVPEGASDKWNKAGLKKFFVSSTQSSPMNDFENLENTLSLLTKRRKAVKTFTSLQKLSKLLSSYSSVASKNAEGLGKVDNYVKELIATLEAKIRMVTEDEMGGAYQAAIAKSFFAALRDMGVEDGLSERMEKMSSEERLNEATDYVTEMGTAIATGSIPTDMLLFSLPKNITLETAKALDDPYLIARCLELGIGNSKEVADGTVRAAAIKLYKATTETSYKSASAAAFSAQAALRLSHIARPSQAATSGDAKESLRYLRLAAARGLGSAQIELAKALEVGDCVDVDIEGAKRWYGKAAGLPNMGSNESLNVASLSGANSNSFEADAALQLARLQLFPGSSEADRKVAFDLLLKAYGVRDAWANESGPQTSQNQQRWVPLSPALQQTVVTVNTVAQFESALELARCFSAGIGVKKDSAQESFWRKQAEEKWEQISTAAVKRLWMALNGKDWFKSPYSIKALLDRLKDQLRCQTTLLRTRFVNHVKSALPEAPVPLRPREPLNSHDTAFEATQYLLLSEIDSIFAKWTTGNIDEEIDIQLEKQDNPSDEGVAILSGLAESIQEWITVAFPGVKHTAGMADALARLWEELRVVQSAIDGDDSIPRVSASLARLLTGSRRRPSDSDNKRTSVIGDSDDQDDEVDRMDEDFPHTGSVMDSDKRSIMSSTSQDSDNVTEAAKAGEDLVTFIRHMADNRKPDSSLVVDDTLSDSWATSVSRLFVEAKNAIKPFIASLEHEISVWTKRKDWSLSVVKEYESVLQSSQAKVIESVLNQIKQENEITARDPTTVIQEDVIGSGLDMTKLGRMPFVWAGASVCMSSQLLDEVTGRLPKIAWTWNEDAHIQLPISPLASEIDDILDQGVTAYFNATESHVNAIALWQQAQLRAQASGDLIREANALSNMGCASRVMGRYSASLSYLALAWQKSCAFVQLVAQQETFSPHQLMGIDLIQMSLTSELVSIEKGANFHFNSSEAVNYVPPSDWSYALGPPIVMWFMRLLVNIGHANLAVGRVDLACQWYDACIQLCDNTIAKHPIPETSSADSKTKIVLLSHVHRVTFLTKVRALTHRGLCYTSMGLVQEGIKSQIVALDLLTEHGSTLGEPERTYRAAIEANLGNIHHARGRLTAAVAHHARSAMLFLQAEDLGAHARELGNLGALWIEIGKALRELEWVRSSDPSFAMVLEQSDNEKSERKKPSTADSVPPRTESVKRKRTVTPKDVSKYPGKFFTVAKAHQPRPNADLDMPLNVGDKISVIMLMEDGVSALGQNEGGWQGTFPLDCIEIEETIAMGSLNTSDEISMFSDLLNKVSEWKDILAGGGHDAMGIKKSSALDTFGGIHCGTSYVEFGLGILRDVVNLGAHTPEVAVNIAAGEIMLHQPYRSMAALLSLVEARSIPSALRKQVKVTLASAYLIIAFANEDESGESTFWPDGTERFLDAELVQASRLEDLLSSLGIPPASTTTDLRRLTRSDVFPILEACVEDDNITQGMDPHDAIIAASGAGPLDAIASSIMGTLEWITSFWMSDVDPEEAMQWRQRGLKRVADSVYNQSLQIGVFKTADPVSEFTSRLDGSKSGGDGAVFTIAAGLHVIESMVQKDPSMARFTESEHIWSSRMEGIIVSGSPELLVWSWAINNARLQVCARCAEHSLKLSIHGANVTTSSLAQVASSSSSSSSSSAAVPSDRSESQEPFPCVHMKADDDLTVRIMPQEAETPRTLKISPSIRKDVVSAVADELLAATIRRATTLRGKNMEKARFRTTSSTNAKESFEDSAIFEKRKLKEKEIYMETDSKAEKANLFGNAAKWGAEEVFEATRAIAGKKGRGEEISPEELVALLKKFVVKALEPDDMLMPSKKGVAFDHSSSKASWINLLYQDAFAAVKRSASDADLPQYSSV